jgi:hypothetical protein
MSDKAKRYRVRANGQPRNPDFLGYPFAVIDTATNKVAMLANTRRSASDYAKAQEIRARSAGSCRA